MLTVLTFPKHALTARRIDFFFHGPQLPAIPP
jgi:hypothetical protein